MGKRVYNYLDLSDKRNIYAIGDVHGCFDLLRQQMGIVAFDASKGDMLISVGDLVDRGPQSLEAKDWCKQPWFKRVLGNHEEMTLDHISGNSYLHTINGGGWMADLPDDEKKEHVDALLDAPYMLEVKTPKGQMIGFVHADLRFSTWQDNIEAPDFKTFTWSRTGVQNLRDPNYDPTIQGIDKVFFGHNALYKPFSRGNCNWIDTGCGFEGGKITLVNVETFGNIIE